ncbi:STAS-like domain-containing protein [Pseudomonas sp. B11D7D]|nr:STAS-like domain-containing protein [Pseudomonas sp. B11D7D]QNH03771.1 STAS-like domain-containing protein [Pseudomonas sp. B11D7D]
MDAYTFQRTDLASRALAAQERKTILAQLDRSPRFTIDLGSVHSISESFADELFGVMVLERGVGFVTSHLRLINANESVLRSIAIAMKRRSAA